MSRPPSKWVTLWSEIRRRHVVRVGVGYMVVAVAFLQGADVVLPRLIEEAETVMRGLVALVVVGFPGALALSWVYDLTPWGVRRTPDLPMPKEAAAEPAPAARAPRPSGPPRSIAVLPFADRSAEHDQDYFADGMAEELINRFARRTQLHVAARTSSFAYREEGRDIREIGEALGVDVVLEGSVRKAGGRLRITAQLVSVSDGYQIWARQFDRSEGDVFAIQDEIATAVTETLRASLRPGVPKRSIGPGTHDAEAYDLYLRGRHFWTRRHRLGLQNALEYFEKSAARDPGFPLPYAGMADVFTVLGIYSFLPGEQAEARAMAAAARALELGEGQPESHIAFGRAVGFFRWAWQEAEDHHVVGSGLEPENGEILASAAQISMFRGRVAEALERAERSVELAPASSFAGALAGEVFLFAGEVERALRTLTAFRELDPEHPPTLFLLGEAYAGQGDYERAIRFLSDAVTLTHRALPFVTKLGSAYAAAGRADEARALRDELLGRAASEYVTPLGPALISANLGEIDRAFEEFGRGLVESRATATQTIRDPAWRPLWSDPRWKDVLDRMGLRPLEARGG